MIFLIGMPGAGKTYWGSKIADAYQLPFVDLDAYIEQREEASVSALFAKYGEDNFRGRERNALKSVIYNHPKNTIVACGGGTPLYFDNMQQMRLAGCVVYLDAELATLQQKLAGDEQTRPLLRQTKSLNQQLKKLLEDRKPFYEEADHIVEVESLSVTTFAEIISECINYH